MISRGDAAPLQTKPSPVQYLSLSCAAASVVDAGENLRADKKMRMN